MSYRAIGLLLIKTKGTRGKVILTSAEIFKKVGTGRGVLFRFFEREPVASCSEDNDSPSVCATPESDQVLTTGADNIPLVMMEPGEMIKSYLDVKGSGTFLEIRVITDRKSFICRQDDEGTTTIPEINCHDLEIHLNSLMVSWEKKTQCLHVHWLSEMIGVGSKTNENLRGHTMIHGVNTVMTGAKRSLIVVHPRTQQRYLLVLDEMNLGPALISIPDRNPPIVPEEIYRARKSNIYLVRDTNKKTWEAWASYLGPCCLETMMQNAQPLVPLSDVYYRAVWSKGRIQSMGSSHVYLETCDRTIKNPNVLRPMSAAHLPVIVHDAWKRLPWTYWNGKKLKLATREGRPNAYQAKFSENDRSKIEFITESLHSEGIGIRFDLPGRAIPGAKIEYLIDSLSIGPLEIDSGLWQVEVAVRRSDYTGELLGAKITEKELIYCLNGSLVDRTALVLRNTSRVVSSSVDDVSPDSDPLDLCTMLFNPSEPILQIPQISTRGAEGTSHGDGVMCDLVHRALERFRDLYLNCQGAGTRFKPGKVREIFSDGHLHGQVLVRIITYLQLAQKSFCSFHLPISLLASLAGRSPTVKELTYFIRKQQDPQTAELILRNRNNYSLYDCSSLEEYLACYAGYDAQEVELIDTTLAHRYFPKGVNNSSMDYHISGEYEVSLGGIELAIRDADEIELYYPGVVLEDPLKDKLRRALDSFTPDQIRGFFTNITGSPVPRTQHVEIAIGRSDGIKFSTCIKKATVSTTWLETATEEEVVRDLTTVVNQMLDHINPPPTDQETETSNTPPRTDDSRQPVAFEEPIEEPIEEQNVNESNLPDSFSLDIINLRESLIAAGRNLERIYANSHDDDSADHVRGLLAEIEASPFGRPNHLHMSTEEQILEIDPDDESGDSPGDFWLEDLEL